MNPLPLLKPAFYTHVLSALLMLIGLVLVATNYKRIRSDPLHMIMVLLLASIAIAIHGHGHIMLEKMYGYDPLYQILG